MRLCLFVRGSSPHLPRPPNPQQSVAHALTVALLRHVFLRPDIIASCLHPVCVLTSSHPAPFPPRRPLGHSAVDEFLAVAKQGLLNDEAIVVISIKGSEAKGHSEARFEQLLQPQIDRFSAVCSGVQVWNASVCLRVGLVVLCV